MKWNIYGKLVGRQLVSFGPDSEDRGEFCPEKYVIKIEKSLSAVDRVQTELHEVIHAVLDRLSIGETRIPVGVEEIISNGLATWITENRKMLAKRFKEIDEKQKRPKRHDQRKKKGAPSA